MLKFILTPPKKVWINSFCTLSPTITVVVPIFNQESIIKDVLKNLISNLTLPSELILIDDASEDLTNYEVRNFFDDANYADFPHICSVSLFRNRFSKFETWCDDFGIQNSNTDYCIEVQADMFINDLGFDKRMLEAMLKFPDLAILSGRGVERLDPVIRSFEKYLSLSVSFGHFVLINIKIILDNIARGVYSVLFSNNFDTILETSKLELQFTEVSDQDFLISGQAGRLGMLIENRISRPIIQERKIYVGETLMRGPILLNRRLYQALNGFDTKSFFLGFDDHDYCARVLQAGFKVGYTPVSFVSPLSFGSTRKKRSIKSELLIFTNLVRIRMRRQYSELFRRWEQQKNLAYPPEIRFF